MRIGEICSRGVPAAAAASVESRSAHIRVFELSEADEADARETAAAATVAEARRGLRWSRGSLRCHGLRTVFGPFHARPQRDWQQTSTFTCTINKCMFACLGVL